jgi:hypothetical protein
MMPKARIYKGQTGWNLCISFRPFRDTIEVFTGVDTFEHMVDVMERYRMSCLQSMASHVGQQQKGLVH